MKKIKEFLSRIKQLIIKRLEEFERQGVKEQRKEDLKKFIDSL